MIRNRRQLIDWLIENAPARYLQRAVSEGQVEFLGWFESIPGSLLPGWITRVTSPITGRSWNVVVRKSVTLPNKFVTWVAVEIRWSQWNTRNSENPFIRGDRHEIYKRLRDNDYVGDGSEVSSAGVRSDTQQINTEQLDK